MMTGKDLIIYILKNNLEDEVIFDNGRFINFLNEQEISAKFGVGVETIKVWCKLDWLPHIIIGDSLLFPEDVTDPREVT